ncbi:MAG TPA: hypothetical protein ENI92_02475 [Bacteroidetes bacterium]|nr:hypothetical protein [Bacteroidota bacterium]
MELSEFERLWPQRDSLNEDLRNVLEEAKNEDPLCRAFADGGDTIRSLLAEMEAVEAPANFAYRMGVYARNHVRVDRPWLDRPWLRWGTVSAGVVAGAMLILLNTGVMAPGNSPPGVPAAGLSESDPGMNAGSAAYQADAASNRLAEEFVDSTQSGTDSLSRDRIESTTRRLQRTVSSEH